MSRMTAGLYAMVLTVLGFVFPLTYFISEGKKDNGVYLSVSIITLHGSRVLSGVLSKFKWKSAGSNRIKKLF